MPGVILILKKLWSSQCNVEITEFSVKPFSPQLLQSLWAFLHKVISNSVYDKLKKQLQQQQNSIFKTIKKYVSRADVPRTSLLGVLLYYVNLIIIQTNSKIIFMWKISTISEKNVSKPKNDSVTISRFDPANCGDSSHHNRLNNHSTRALHIRESKNRPKISQFLRRI